MSTETQWISVEAGLPDLLEEVLGYDASVRQYAVTKRRYASWAWTTHWMPLPAPPQEQTNDH